MMNFNKGEYVVLLSYPSKKCKWEDSMPLNYCYILDRDTDKYVFGVEEDISLKPNGWWLDIKHDELNEYGNLNFRLATVEERLKYEVLKEPFKVDEIEIINDYSYLKNFLKKIKYKMKVLDLKVGDKLGVFVKTNRYTTINSLGDIIEITGITQDVNGTLWISHTPVSFSGGGFRICNDDGTNGYKLGVDVILISESKPKKETHKYLTTLLKQLNIR